MAGGNVAASFKHALADPVLTPRWSLCVESGGARRAKMIFFLMVFNVCDLMSWGLDKEKIIKVGNESHKKCTGL